MRAAIGGTAAVLLVALASACGGGDEASAPETSAEEPARTLPACAGPVGSAAPELPVHFPLPPGTAIVSSESPHTSQLVVLGLIPAELQEAASFFSDTLPEHGYQVGVGDAEGTESEAPFTGNGYRGKWRVNEIPDCPALRLTLVLIEQS